MDKVFLITVQREDDLDRERCVSLMLPAFPYELLDALDRLRADRGTPLCARVEDYFRFPFLSRILPDRQELYGLNSLARQLVGLTPGEAAAFHGLVKMEDKPISLERLMGLAHNTGCCHVVDEARNDKELGRFYAENGFIPGAAELPDELFDLLDFERIGREQRQAEGGVFAEGCYVVRHSQLMEASLAPEPLITPDYTILLEAFDDSGESIQLKLPAEAERLEGLTRWVCLDCAAPMLREAVSAETDIHAVRRIAECLGNMTREELLKYKALLEFADCPDLRSAERLSQSMDAYLLTTGYATPSEVAWGELVCILEEADREEMLPYLDLYSYGLALLDRRGGMLSGYGLVERSDGEPILTMGEPLERELTM